MRQQLFGGLLTIYLVFLYLLHVQSLTGFQGLLRNKKDNSCQRTYPASSGFSRPDATLRWERNHCVQPFPFPSNMRVHVMTTNIQRQDSNENFNKTIGLISKTTTLHVHHAFIFAFLCDFCTTTTWRCLILRLWITQTSNDEIYSSFRSWTWIWSLGIQLHLGSPTFDKVTE